MRVPFQFTSPYYDNVEFTVATGTTNYNVATNQSGLFGGSSSSVDTPLYFISLRTDQDVTIRLNSTSDDGITVAVQDSPVTFDETVEVSNVFITNNSGSTANIKILTAKSAA